MLVVTSYLLYRHDVAMYVLIRVVKVVIRVNSEPTVSYMNGIDRVTRRCASLIVARSNWLQLLQDNHKA